tara:strand:+ start:3291 stop:3671 length:381 start_codon:yes stop_codon:yes gene_type:complete
MAKRLTIENVLAELKKALIIDGVRYKELETRDAIRRAIRLLQKQRREEDLDPNNLEFYRSLLWSVAITYPKVIFHRRYALMSQKQKDDYHDAWHAVLEKIVNLADDMDEADGIMVQVAEEANDPWP